MQQLCVFSAAVTCTNDQTYQAVSDFCGSPGSDTKRRKQSNMTGLLRVYSFSMQLLTEAEMMMMVTTVKFKKLLF